MDKLRSAEVRRSIKGESGQADQPLKVLNPATPEPINPRFSLRPRALVAATRAMLGIRPAKLQAQSSPSLFWWR